MSRLTIFNDDAPTEPLLRTEEPEEIAEALRPIGVRFERWALPAEQEGALPQDADADAILAAYRPHLDALMGETGAGTADVLTMRPGLDAYPAMRQKFLHEHTHTEDEVRFFVRGSGNPYARTRLPAFLAETGGSAETAALVEETRRLSGGQEPLEALLAWMDRDAKAGPLKAIQGLIWNEGYANGGLVGALYPDVAPNLKRLRAAGLRLFVYSSGSVQAQRLLFGHSVAGDLTGSFDGFFDTAIGGKREASSYRRLADAAGFACEAMLFLSDVAEELAAASAAGMATLQIVRTGDRTVPAPGFAQAASFDGVLAEEASPEP